MIPIDEVAHLVLPTWAGEFDLRAFQSPSGSVYLLFLRGELGDGRGLLTRVHSACLTGDALGSLRCECGPQLRLAMQRIAAEGRGALLYAPYHEGRGIGLLAKLKAYELQDQGHDTVEANRELGLPVDSRDYREAVLALAQAGIRGVRLLTNNPEKARALEEGGIAVEEVVPLQTAPHTRNFGYLETKRQRLGHLAPGGAPLATAGIAADDRWTESPNGQEQHPLDVTPLLGEVRRGADRPYVVLKYAQTLDGRIATASGDAKWISGLPERRVSHAMRAACDAVMVGIGTVLRDDPRLTVRLVPGASPIRVILDSRLRVPPHAGVVEPDAVTIVLTTARSSPDKREALRERRVRVEVVEEGPDGVDLRGGLARLAELGIRSLLAEGGARVITSLLREGLADRVVVALAPLLLGKGTEAVGDLGVAEVVHALRLVNPTRHAAGTDLLIAGDLAGHPPVQG
jgi:3,4-dihydroxy 2-butanone 4-phosphate synthase/GTP cyclohydrolase II